MNKKTFTCRQFPLLPPPTHAVTSTEKGLTHRFPIQTRTLEVLNRRKTALTFASFTMVLQCVSTKHNELDVWRQVTKRLMHTRGST